MATSLEQLRQILEEAPNVPGYGGGKWAIYSIGCCWWTSDPEAFGRNMRERGHTGLPQCPSCSSVLLQAPLEGFIDAAITGHPDVVLPKFILARDNPMCFTEWMRY